MGAHTVAHACGAHAATVSGSVARHWRGLAVAWIDWRGLAVAWRWLGGGLARLAWLGGGLARLASEHRPRRRTVHDDQLYRRLLSACLSAWTAARLYTLIWDKQVANRSTYRGLA